MSLNAAALEYLADKGLTLAEVIEFARIAERKTDSTNAERQARHREKKADERNALRNGVTGNGSPKDIYQTPSGSEANASVAEATGQVEIDPAKQLFDLGIDLMVRTEGMTDKQARSYIGGLRKDHGEANALNAVIEARFKNISRPAEWLPKRCKSQAPPGQNRQALYRQADRIIGEAA